MVRAFCLSLLSLTLAVSAAVAVPARPLYEPVPPPKLPAPVFANLNGTAWLGKYLTIKRIYILEADGTVSYRSTTKSGKEYRNRGHWRLEGNRLFFDHHIGANKLLEFRGVIQDANTIVGEQVILRTGARSQVIMRRTAIPR